jgi:hypothetical protein
MAAFFWRDLVFNKESNGARCSADFQLATARKAGRPALRRATSVEEPGNQQVVWFFYEGYRNEKGTAGFRTVRERARQGRSRVCPERLGNLLWPE